MKKVWSFHFLLMLANQSPIEWLPEEIQALSSLQRQICEARAASTSTDYGLLAKQFGLTSHSSITTCIKKTISGNYWDESSGAGQIGYLSDVQTLNSSKKLMNMALF